MCCFSNLLSKIKKKIKIKRKYSELQNDIDSDEELSVHTNISINKIIEQKDLNEFINEPITMIKKISLEQEIKKKVIIDKLIVIFEKNDWYLDTISYKKIKSDEFAFLRCVDNLHEYEQAFEKQRNDLINNNEKDVLSISLHESRCKNNIEKIIKKCFIYFETPYGASNMIRTGLCNECMKKVYIDENLCHVCGNVFFEKCCNNCHEFMNKNLPLKKRYSQDFMYHIFNCILNNEYYINDLY
jgi:hypothetical protein